MVWEFQIVQWQLLSPYTSLLFLIIFYNNYYDVIYVSWKEPRLVVYASDNALSEKTAYQV